MNTAEQNRLRIQGHGEDAPLDFHARLILAHADYIGRDPDEIAVALDVYMESESCAALREFLKAPESDDKPHTDVYSPTGTCALQHFQNRFITSRTEWPVSGILVGAFSLSYRSGIESIYAANYLLTSPIPRLYIVRR